MKHVLLASAAALLAGCSGVKTPSNDTGGDAHQATAHGGEAAEAHESPDHGGSGHVAPSHGETFHDTAAQAAAPGATAGHGSGAHPAEAPHWTYTSQDAWAKVSREAAACAVGGRQSPINLYGDAESNLPELDFAYAGVEGDFFNNGHTLQVAVPQGLAFTAGGKAYSLAQAHFHSPSEHVVDGERFGLELHFVHKTAEGKLAVVGVLFREGAENPALRALFAKMPPKVGEASAVKVYFDPSAFMPADRAYFRYAGSLTTPPCSEGVEWRVIRAPLTASKVQIEAFREIVGENARDLQPLNGREVAFGD